jgi:hypothetical protein
MNKTNKARIVNLASEALAKKHPNFPKNAIPTPKYLDATANGLTKCIIDFLNNSGWQAERISNTGRFIAEKKMIGTTSVFGTTKSSVGKYIKGTGTNGTADISATIKGRSVKVEVKIGKDIQSSDQLKYQNNITQAGGVYLIAKNMDSFLDWYDNFIG